MCGWNVEDKVERDSGCGGGKLGVGKGREKDFEGNYAGPGVDPAAVVVGLTANLWL